MFHKVLASINCDRLKPMLGNADQLEGGYPGKFAQRLNRVGGGLGMSQLHQLRMGVNPYSGQFGQNMGIQNQAMQHQAMQHQAMQHQAMQNQPMQSAVTLSRGPLKFGKRLGLSGK